MFKPGDAAQHDRDSEVEVKRRFVEVMRIQLPLLYHLDRAVEMVRIVFMIKVARMSLNKGSAKGKGYEEA